jgi:VWFA-related protein
MIKMRIARVTGVAVLAASMCLSARLPVGAAAAQDTQRKLFVAVVNKDGTPVTDLTAADFEVKEGGKAQTLTSVAPAKTPLRVHIIVSDSGTGAFQLGVLKFVQALSDRSEFAFTSVLIQAMRTTDYTSNVQQLGTGIEKLGRRGTITGRSQLMDALEQGVKDLGAPGKHPVLVVLRMGNEEASTTPATRIREALRQSGATMYVISRSGASKPAPRSAGTNSSAETAQRQMDDAEMADTSLNLNLVLGDGSRESGGFHQEIPLQTAAPVLEQLANEIKGQYEITYTLPAGTKPSDKVQVTTKRKNVVLRAPQKIAN